MESSVKITLIIVSALIVLALIGGYAFMQTSPATQTVSATGQSTIKAVPDLVTINFIVQTNADTSQEANDKNAEITDKLITDLVKIGFERKDIVTENFNVYPDYDWSNGNQRLKGYIATHNVKVEIPTTNTDRIGKTIDAGVNAGALVSYINFELSSSKQNEIKADALKKAAEDAKTKAGSIAAGLGKRLGEIVSTSSSNFDYYPWPLYSNAEMKADSAGARQAVTNIQQGEQEVSASVSVVYRIK